MSRAEGVVTAETVAGVTLWNDRGLSLDDDQSVTAAGLCSGARVWLAADAPPATPAPVAVELAVVGGPDLGPPTVLGPGRHTVGGTSTDDVSLLGADLPAAAVTVAVSEVGSVTLGPGDGTDEVFPAETLDAGEVVSIGPFSVRVRRLGSDLDVVDASGGVPFNRTPYRPVPDRTRSVPPLPAPPSPPSPSRMAITSFVVPLASGTCLLYTSPSPRDS